MLTTKTSHPSGRKTNKPDLFYLKCETILRRQEELPGFIISERTITNIRYTDDPMLVSDSTEKLKEI